MAERKLYYTTNGVDPTNGSTPYSGSFAVNNGVTVKAVAYLDAWASLISSKVCAISIPSPTIVVGNMGSVSFTRINGDCYYTINGSTPATASTKYTSGNVPVNSGTVVKAICVYRGGTSPVATETVTYSVPTPSISISKTGIVTVTKGSGDISGSVIRYTTNGSSPTTSSPVFSSLTATNGQNIKVASFYGGVKSGDASAWYYDAPTISAGGNVTISGASGAVIRYTTDGSEPNSSSPQYTGAFTPSANTVIKAIQILNGFTSATRTAQFVAMPSVSVTGDGYVTITAGASTQIRYALNAVANGSSTVYTGGFYVDSGVTVNCIGLYNGGTSANRAQGVSYSIGAPTMSQNVWGEVSISKNVSGYPNSVIRYTTNGSEPSGSSPIWTGVPVNLTGSTFKAKNFYQNVSSGTTSIVSTISVPAPSMSIDSWGVVTVSGSYDGCVIKIGIGTQANNDTPTYTGPFDVNSGQTASAGFFHTDKKTYGDRVNKSVTITVPSPTINVINAEGLVSASKNSGDNSGSVLRYTTNATDPTSSSPVLSGSIYVDSGAVFRVRSFFKNVYSGVPSQTVTYTIDAPSMSQNDWGEITINKNVSGFAGSVIRYTTNGTEPNASSPIWSGVPEALWGSTYKARNFYRNISSTTTSLVSVNSIPAPNMSIDEWGLVTVSGTYAGCVIVYDKGKNADLPSPVYNGPFDVDSNQMASACFLHTGKKMIGNRVNKTVTFSVPNPNIGTSAIGRISMSRGAGDTPRSTIRYTMDGADPTSSSMAYTDSFIVSGNAIIKARTFFKNVQSGVTTVYQNDAPVITNNKNGTVTITGGLSGSTIIYSVSGYGNNVTDKTYTGTFSIVGGAATVTAYITQGGFKSGTTTRFCVYSVSAPTVTVDTNGLVTMSRTESITNSVLRYTTDGSEPTGSSTAYSGQFTISGTSKTIKAKTFNEVNSGTTTQYYTDPPTFSNNNRTVTMNNRSGTTYWGYGTGTPTNVYSSPFTASGGGTISLRGMNVFNGFTSRLSSHAIVVPVAPTIRFYDNDLGRATIHFSGSGSIRYTIDGTDPTTSSTAQTVGNGVKFLVVMDRTVKATVVLNGVYSDVTSKVYKMQVKYVTITTPTQSKVPVVYANFEQITRYTTDGTTPTDSSTILNSGTAYASGEMRVRTKDVNTGEWLHEGFFANVSSNSINWNADITEVKAVNSLADEIEIQLTPRATGATYLYRTDHFTPVRPNWTNSIQYKSDRPFSFRMPSGDTLSWLAIGSNGIGGAVYSFSGRCTVEI